MPGFFDNPAARNFRPKPRPGFMTEHIKPRWFVALAAFSVTLGILFSWPALGGPLLDRFMAYRWSIQIERATDAEAKRLIRRAAAMGRAGISVLVQALGHRRAAVAQAAASALKQHIQDWQQLPAETGSANVARLASCLARNADDFGATAQGEATLLATAILTWPLDACVDRVQVVADCEQVLMVALKPGSPAGQKPVEHVTRSEVGVLRRQATPQPSDSAAAATYLSSDAEQIPGGNIPFEMVEIPSLPPSLEHPYDLESPDPDEPNLMPPAIKQMPGLLFPDEHEPSPMHADTIPTRRQARSPAEEPSLVEPNSPDRPVDMDAEQMQHLSTREVMTYLHVQDAAQVRAAQDELIARGFDTYELGAARRLGSPEPEDRLELAGALSALPISPVRWLLWLSHDTDARVRLNAVSLMATSTDPRLTGRLQEMLRTERDRRVNEVLDRWARLKR
jgi:hypothetical protein